MTRGEIALFLFIFLLVYMAEWVPRLGAKVGARFDRRGRGNAPLGKGRDEQR